MKREKDIDEEVEDEPECQGWYSLSVPSRRFKKRRNMK